MAKNKEYAVYRNKKYIGTHDATSKEDAINKAIDMYHYENYGQAGAMTEFEVSRANMFEAGNFKAKREK